jgi:hypothetical protein
VSNYLARFEPIHPALVCPYVGSGQKLLPYRLGSHDLQFFDGDWAYMTPTLGKMISSAKKLSMYNTKSPGQ